VVSFKTAEALAVSMARTTPPTVDGVLADLRERGYEIDRPEGRATPAAVATGGEAPGARTDAPLAVEPLGDPTPLYLVARLADATRDGRVPLLVVDEGDVDAALDVLRPPLLVDDDTDGLRTFYPIPDRIRLTDGTLACVRTDGDFTWREVAAGELAAADSSPDLVLETAGETVAAFDGVDGLTCPGPDPDAFPHRYEWGADKRIHVFDRDGEVGRYDGVAAMRDNAYRPVPLPLVPEHHVRENAALTRQWRLATVVDGTVRYRTG
jgi:hypothetical protein